MKDPMSIQIKVRMGWSCHRQPFVWQKWVWQTDVGSCFLGKKHQQDVMESQFPVSGEIPAGVDGIFAWISDNFIDC